VSERDEGDFGPLWRDMIDARAKVLLSMSNDGRDIEEAHFMLVDALIAAAERRGMERAAKHLESMMIPCAPCCDAHTYGRAKYCNCGRADANEDLEESAAEIRRVAEAV
jgi:hypothetical protein